jgi:hypothetical protein
LLGEKCQHHQHEEEIHVSRETDEKEVKMKVKVDPLRGFGRKGSEKEGVNENKAGRMSLMSANAMATVPSRST